MGCLLRKSRTSNAYKTVLWLLTGLITQRKETAYKKKHVPRDESHESEGELKNRKVSRKIRTSKVVVIQELPSVLVKKTQESSGKLKGIKMLSEAAQLELATQKAIKDSRRTKKDADEMMSSESFDITNTDDERTESESDDHGIAKQGKTIAETEEEENANSEHEEDDTKGDDQKTEEDPKEIISLKKLNSEFLTYYSFSPSDPQVIIVKDLLDHNGDELQEKYLESHTDGLKKGKFHQSVKEHEHEVQMNLKEPIFKNVANDADEPHWFNRMVQAVKPPFTFDELMSTPIDFLAFAMNPSLDRQYHKRSPRGSNIQPTQRKNNIPRQLRRHQLQRYTWKGIEDMIPTLWSPVVLDYDKDAPLGIKHWRPQRQQFYRAMINTVSKHKVFSTMRILSVVSVQVEKKLGYGYLKEIVIRRADQTLYKIKEGDFLDLHLNDIEDMLLLIAQNKLFNPDGDVIVDFVPALKLFTRGIILKNKTLLHRLKNFRLGFNLNSDMSRRE
ncbi:hypothetical protein Tco_0620123 [Tanacetum coccineum]